MARVSFASLWVRLFLLVFLAVVPALVAILYTAAEERQLARTQVQESTQRLVRLAAAEQRRFLQSTHQLLAALAHSRVVRDHDATACSAVLGEFLGGMSEIPGLDETPRLHVFTPVKGLPDVGMYISIGIPTDIAFADVRGRLVRNLVLWSVVVLLALLASWFGGDLFILRSVKRLTTAVERLSTGDLSVRIGPLYGEGDSF